MTLIAQMSWRRRQEIEQEEAEKTEKEVPTLGNRETRGGMTIGTIFTLFVVPSLYALIAKQHRVESTEPEMAPAVELAMGRSAVRR